MLHIPDNHVQAVSTYADEFKKSQKSDENMHSNEAGIKQLYQKSHVSSTISVYNTGKYGFLKFRICVLCH